MSTSQRTFTAVVNPVSGGGDAPRHWDAVGHLLERAGHDVEVVVTTGRSHAIDTARAAAQRGRIAVAVGGDGTVRDVVNGATPAGGTVGIVPGGRGNDLAELLGISRQPAAAAELLQHGSPRCIDVLRTGDQLVPGNVYLGLDGRATQIVNALRWVPALVLYRVAPFLATVGWRRFGVHLDSTDGSPADAVLSSSPAHMVIVANSGRYGHGLHMVPSASLDDGLLDVLLVKGVNVLRLANLSAQAVNGTHLSRPDIATWRATRVAISSPRRLAVFADGEQIGQLPCTVEVLPGALSILAPPR